LIYFSKSVFKCCTCWAWLRTFCISWPEAIDLRDEIGFYQAIQSALKKSEISERDDVDLDHAIQQLRPFLRIDAINLLLLGSTGGQIADSVGKMKRGYTLKHVTPCIHWLLDLGSNQGPTDQQKAGLVKISVAHLGI
jgi:hypothetical protein